MIFGVCCWIVKFRNAFVLNNVTSVVTSIDKKEPTHGFITSRKLHPLKNDANIYITNLWQCCPVQEKYSVVVVLVWEEVPRTTTTTTTAIHTSCHSLCRCWCYNNSIGRWYSGMFIPHDRRYSWWNHEIDRCVEDRCGQKGPHYQCRKEDGPWLVRIVRNIPCWMKRMISTKTKQIKRGEGTGWGVKTSQVILSQIKSTVQCNKTK